MDVLPVDVEDQLCLQSKYSTWLECKAATETRLITSLCCVEASRSLASSLVSRGQKEPSCLAGGQSETAFYSTVGNGWLDEGEFCHEPHSSSKGPYSLGL